MSREAAQPWEKGVDLRGGQWCLTADIKSEFGLVAGFNQRGPEKAQDGVTVFGGGAERTQGVQERVEEARVRVGIGDAALDDFEAGHGGVEGVDRAACRGEGFFEFPGGEQGEGVGVFDAGQGFAARENFEAAGELGVLAFRALGDGADEARSAAKKRDGLAGFRPIPDPDTDRIVFEQGHARQE